MNWIESLYKTYEACQVHIGYSATSQNRPLLPVCHITTKAHIEVVLNQQGYFRRASLVNPADATTIIPSSEGSASRSGSKPENHPLCDKLQYVAGDFVEYGGVVTSGYKKDPEEPYRNLFALASQWCNSPYRHPKIEAVLEYLKRRTLMRDLISSQILFIGDSGKLISKDEVQRERSTFDIFSLVNSQEDAFVRWVVETPDSQEHRVWRDKTLWQSWSNYYLTCRKESALCIATGTDQIISTNHPKYILREGDGRKLISANDTEGYTYRGRFIEGEQACSVGLEASQKAHYALTWLISRQGYVKGDLAIVAWAISGTPVPQPTDDGFDLYSGLAEDDSPIVDIGQETAKRLNSRIAGYGKVLGETEDVAVMAVDSATPGRLSIIYYRLLTGSDFLARIDHWHTSCAWLHRYHRIEEKDEKGKPYFHFVPFIGAPAPADIAEVAYATNRKGKFEIDDALRKATIKRLLPCIIDGHPVPRDLVEMVVRRASNPVGLEGWQWGKTLSIACALFRKHKEGKEIYSMSLDENRTTRDYLYGRLLAIADVLEERALSDGEKNRATNATRYMQQFSQRPFRTWKQIHDQLNPYLMRLGDQAKYYKSLIGQVEGLFTPEDYTSNKPLTGEYLLGYYCQRQKMWEKKEKTTTHETQTQETN